MSAKPILSGLIFSTALFSATTFAATAGLVANVTTVMVANDGNFGGCMALLSVDPQSVLPACGGGWVTFSCTGDFGDQTLAYRSLDQAQLALASGKSIYVTIDDSKRHNGYCFANRIDVF